MNLKILAGVAALAIVGTTSVAAQNYGYNRDADRNGNAFWNGAPANPRDRIAFLQDRINRGMADGSLNRGEGRDAQIELNSIKRDAWHGRWDDRHSAMVQQRLDDLSRRLHWLRRNGAYAGGPGNYRGNDPSFATNYDASHYYRGGPNYSERRLTSQDEVYRGSDGQYYCKRNDGTTGLIVGGIGGAGLGNIIDGGHSRAAGTLIGGALGALLGKSIDQNSDVRCR